MFRVKQKLIGFLIYFKLQSYYRIAKSLRKGRFLIKDKKRYIIGGEKMASNTVLKQKEEEVNKLAEKLKDAKVILLTDYRGINVADVTKLRTDLRETNSEYKVIKNNIIKRALNVNGENGLDDLLEGPTAIIIGTEDYLEPSKVIYNFSKKNDFYKIKGGIIEGKVMTAEEIITLAKLPSRQELLAKLAGALLGNITKLAVALDAVKVQKEN